jgi:hypothetical protein
MLGQVRGVEPVLTMEHDRMVAILRLDQLLSTDLPFTIRTIEYAVAISEPQ